MSLEKHLENIKVTEVSAGYTFTKSLGNYQTAKIHFGATADVPPEATADLVVNTAERLFAFCSAAVAKQSRLIDERL